MYVCMHAQAFSFSSHTLYHRHDINKILLLWHKTQQTIYSVGPLAHQAASVFVLISPIQSPKAETPFMGMQTDCVSSV